MQKTYELLKKRENSLTEEEMFLLLIGVSDILYMGDAVNRREHELICRAFCSAFRGLCEDEEQTKQLIKSARERIELFDKMKDDKHVVKSILQQIMDKLNG